MTAFAAPALGVPAIFGPDPLELEGRRGARYWVHHPSPLTGNAVVDERLAGYPVAVFQPHGRLATETPVVIGLQGMAAPYQWNAFLVPTLLDMGIACVLFDTPFAGERSLSRNYQGHVLSEVRPLWEQNIRFRADLVLRLMETVARDFHTVRALLQDRHGLNGDRLALFGVSLGTLLAGFTFLRDGVGQRLLGTIGHADLSLFAGSYSPRFTPLLTLPPIRLLGKLAGFWFGPLVPAGLDFLVVLRELSAGGQSCAGANPMVYADRIGCGRRVRFLVGREDPLVRPDDATACARRFPDGECYVVPGLGHGQGSFGPSFVEHARTFVGTQLGDWRW